MIRNNKSKKHSQTPQKWHDESKACIFFSILQGYVLLLLLTTSDFSFSYNYSFRAVTEETFLLHKILIAAAAGLQKTCSSVWAFNLSNLT